MKTGIEFFKVFENYILSRNYVIFKVDYNNELLTKTVEETIEYHEPDLSKFKNFEEKLVCCLQLITNLIYKFCISNISEYNTYPDDVNSITAYFKSLIGFPNIDGSLGISIDVLNFYVDLISEDFIVEKLPSCENI